MLLNDTCINTANTNIQYKQGQRKYTVIGNNPDGKPTRFKCKTCCSACSPQTKRLHPAKKPDGKHSTCLFSSLIFCPAVSHSFFQTPYKPLSHRQTLQPSSSLLISSYRSKEQMQETKEIENGVKQCSSTKKGQEQLDDAKNSSNLV